MRRACVLFLALAVWPAYAGLIEGRVIEVQDGDSVTVLSKESASRHRVRLAGIAVPPKEHPLWDRSRENLRRLAVGKTVLVDSSTLDGKGRLVGTVWVIQRAKECRAATCEEKLDAGQAQLASGFAWIDKDQLPRYAADVQKTYAQAEQRARQNKLGLWRDANLPLRAEFREPTGAVTRADLRGPRR